MFSNSNCASVPLVANIDGNGNNGGWADGGWLWIIVVFALLFGWGNGGFMQRKVLIHEVCHAICMSYDVYLPIEQEEILCDFVATYGDEVFDIVDMVLGAARRVG